MSSFGGAHRTTLLVETEQHFSFVKNFSLTSGALAVRSIFQLPQLLCQRVAALSSTLVMRQLGVEKERVHLRQ